MDKAEKLQLQSLVLKTLPTFPVLVQFSVASKFGVVIKGKKLFFDSLIIGL